MGVFIQAEELQAKKMPGANALEGLESEDIEDMFIAPAEKAIELACCLSLNTDGHPWRWSGRFTAGQNAARLLDEYLTAYRRAVILTVNDWAANPYRQSRRSHGRASEVRRTQLVPTAAKALMAKWTEPRRVYR